MKHLSTAAERASTAIKNCEDCEEKLRKARKTDKKKTEKAAARVQEIILKNFIALRSVTPSALDHSKHQQANTNYQELADLTTQHT